MRPESVKRFELLFFLSLGLGMTISVLTWRQTTQMAGAGFALTVQAAVLLILLGLVLLVSRKGSNIARWVLVTLFVIGVIIYIPSVAVMYAQSPLAAMLSLVQFALQVAAIYLVFRPDAKSWFRKDQREIEAE
jgi:hypothetical protein